tara:strand:- start:212 stop:997 length:786 start_codon:yes stop_codon:yes gene_type:complete
MHITEYLKDNNYKSPYIYYSRNYVSQNGEDGIIEQILNELDISNGNVMEFGAWDGIYLCNTYLLYKTGNFNAILVESDTNRFNKLKKNTEKLNNVEIYNCLISPDSDNINSVDSIVNKSKFNINNNNFTILVIDVDSIDYYIFNGIQKYNPILIIVECINKYKITDEYINNDGASLYSLTQLANSKNYTLICYNLNAFFIRNDYINKLKSYNNNLSINDYDAPVKILQKINKDGNIFNDINNNIRYYQSEQYNTIIKNESA